MPLDLAALLDPTHTAVVTMELQRGVVGEGAAIRELADVVAAHDVVDRAVDVVARGADGGRARRALHRGVPIRSRRVARQLPAAAHALAKGGPGPVAGAPMPQWSPELGPEPSDLISPRSHGLTPFPGTGLDQILRNIGTRTIVATGVSLNVGVTGLVMVAVDLGYDVVVVTDAVAAMPWEYGAAVLEHTIAPLATRSTSAEVIATWARLQRC